MPRVVVQAARARGSLAVDPKTDEGQWAGAPERVLAWDEDETTLAIEAAAALPRAPRAVVGPGIDAEALRVALDLPAPPVTASDPMAVALGATGPVLAVGCPPGTLSAVAALVDDGEGPGVAAPRDVGHAPRMVSALRALQESRRVPPAEDVPDSPMGAYVPWGTWLEDLPARLRLVAQRCAACGRAAYPPRGACPACRGRSFEDAPLAREAVVHAATRIGRGGAPSEFALEQAQVGAYWVAVVEWPAEGVKVAARLAGYGEEGPAIGDRVRPVVRRLFTQEGRVRYGVKFAPAG
ncbi:MAG TPA: zinc ribbon domain-containing protein [Candidatus Thermoplasmatota archaeon]|nr:zinc ribbon domain-containing protein [Candidatus Thermoplasmatota archaeon]